MDGRFHRLFRCCLLDWNKALFIAPPIHARQLLTSPQTGQVPKSALPLDSTSTMSALIRRP